MQIFSKRSVPPLNRQPLQDDFPQNAEARGKQRSGGRTANNRLRFVFLLSQQFASCPHSEWAQKSNTWTPRIFTPPDTPAIRRPSVSSGPSSPCATQSLWWRRLQLPSGSGIPPENWDCSPRAQQRRERAGSNAKANLKKSYQLVLMSGSWRRLHLLASPL